MKALTSQLYYEGAPRNSTQYWRRTTQLRHHNGRGKSRQYNVEGANLDDNIEGANLDDNIYIYIEGANLDNNI
jgi:hypothetical protein